MCGAWICASGMLNGGNDTSDTEHNNYTQGQKVFDEKDLQGGFDLMGLMKIFSGRQ